MNQRRRAWTSSGAASLHLTLKFLGETTIASESIAEALRQAVSIPAFPLVLSGTGAFPNPSHARVVWAGITEGGEPLVTLARQIDEASHQLGFAREARPFEPHLTLARAKHGKASAADVVGTSDELGRMIVRKVTLYRSELRPTGAVHTPLAVLPLTQ